tara:strand:- start:206 stop:571 length:366 start_codon:yes stop_codon:yes gene_type:complete
MSSTIVNELDIIKQQTCCKIDNTDINNNTSKIKNNYNSLNNIEAFLNNKVINIYSRPWNKLESKLKKHKIKEYIDKEVVDKNLDNETYINLINELYKSIDFKKKIKLEYDIENCIITKLNY